MDRQVSMSIYMISTVIVWVAILAASAVILRGTPYFGQMLPVLGAGVVWFIVILPAAFLKEPGK